MPGFEDISYDLHETIDGDHGKIETRRYWTTSDIDWLQGRVGKKAFVKDNEIIREASDLMYSEYWV